MKHLAGCDNQQPPASPGERFELDLIEFGAWTPTPARIRVMIAARKLDGWDVETKFDEWGISKAISSRMVRDDSNISIGTLVSVQYALEVTGLFCDTPSQDKDFWEIKCSGPHKQFLAHPHVNHAHVLLTLALYGWSYRDLAKYTGVSAQAWCKAVQSKSLSQNLQNRLINLYRYHRFSGAIGVNP